MCINDRMKKFGISFEQGEADYNKEALLICEKYDVTRDQILSYMFSDKFTTKTGRKCTCAECKELNRLKKLHYAIER